MRRIFSYLLIVFLFLGGLAYSQTKDVVYVIPVKGVIDLGLSGFIKRALEEAKEAEAVIFEIDTFGGRVDAAVDICRYIKELAPEENFAYITDQAWSAGALISLACRRIIMSPGSSIGSAEPRKMGMAQQAKTDEKTVSAIRAKFKSIAEENGHPANLAEAMVDKDVELKRVNIKGQIEILSPEEIEEKKEQFRDRDIKIEGTVIQKGKLLNLTAGEAKELNLVEAIVPSRGELLAYANLEGRPIIETTLNWSEALVRFLTHPVVSSILLTLGSLGLIFELRMPGWGISGTLGLISLALFFWGHYLVGLANWTEIVLFLTGVALLGLEVFVIPGFGLAGISGILLMLAGIFLALVKHPLAVPRTELIGAFYVMSSAVIATFLVAVLTFRFIPQSGLWRRLVLATEETRQQGFESKPESTVLPGEIGTTFTILRPAGKAIFSDNILDVVTEGEFIEKDRKVKVLKVEGNRVVVEEVRGNA